MDMQRTKRRISGRTRAPASKSSMQRAVACAMLAEGTSRLYNGSLCADSRAALDLARTLGATIAGDENFIAIDGSPLFTGAEGSAPAHTAASLDLHCGESGLCMRMFSPLAALLPFKTRLLGSGSLEKRPMHMMEAPLRALGALCTSNQGLPPVTLQGPLHGGTLSLDAGESSQFLTGLLIALPLAHEDSVVSVAHAVSTGYLDLTLGTCAAFGVQIERNSDFSRFFIKGNQRYRATDFMVEGDWSSAAFLVVAAAIAGRDSSLAIEGLSLQSSQPDISILDASRSAGADVLIEGDVISVKRGAPKAFEFDATDCPDLFPPLAALAAACEGRSAIRGIHRLKGKESDRAESLKSCFGALGIAVELKDDVMFVEGGTLRGGTVDSHNDHRIAMAAAVAALAASGPVTIRGSECVAKSWPGFFADLDSICT